MRFRISCLLFLLLFYLLNSTPVAAFSSANKGVAWNLGVWYNTPLVPNQYNFEGIKKDLDYIKYANIGWVRLTMDKYTQTSCSSTSFYSKIRDELKLRGIKAQVLINIPGSTTTAATDSERLAFKQWLNTMVTCYKNDFSYWEIGNEVNLKAFWNIDENTTDTAAYTNSVRYYTLYLQDAYTIIKTIDPNLKVIHAGLSQWKYERYVDILATLNTSSYFDIFAFHPYSQTGPQGSLDFVKAFKTKLNQYPQFSNKPIYINEVGFSSNPNVYTGKAGSEDLKAQYLTDTYNLLLNSGVVDSGLPIIWYDFAQDEKNADVVNNGYELVYEDRGTLSYIHRKAYLAMQNLWPNSTPAISPPINKFDVNFDGVVTLLDALDLLKEIFK